MSLTSMPFRIRLAKFMPHNYTCPALTVMMRTEEVGFGYMDEKEHIIFSRGVGWEGGLRYIFGSFNRDRVAATWRWHACVG